MVVRDGRIAAAGPRASTPIPAGVRVIDVNGATIAPGLWDMHAHAAQIEWLPAYLAAGVTTFRDMGGEQPFLTAMRDTVASGKGLGPRVLLAGLVDGDAPGAFGAVVAATPDQGRAIVDRYKAAGFDQMKLYSLLQPDVVSAIIARAHELGMSVTGHVPTALGLTRAVEAGMDHVAHLPINGDPQSPQTRAIDRAAGKAQDRDRSDAAVERIARPRAGDAAREFRARLRACAAGAARELPQREERHRRRDREAARARFGDDGQGALRCGRADRRRHRRRAARLQPAAIDRDVCRGRPDADAGDRIGDARARGVDGPGKDAGTIEPGKRADLIVLNADPLAQISNIRKLRWVVANGRVSNRRSCGPLRDSNEPLTRDMLR